jgi:CRISPR-associated protein Cas5d
VLREVEYIIEAHFEMTGQVGPGDNPGKHLDMARRRIERGQCAYQPSLGTREFTAFFGPVEPEESAVTPEALQGERDLGWMLHDIDFADGMTPHFFHAVLRDGVLDVPLFTSGRAVS